MKRYLLIITLLLIIPFTVNAETKTYDFCDTCQWNNNNIDEMEHELRGLKGYDTVVINFKPGGPYKYIDFPTQYDGGEEEHIIVNFEDGNIISEGFRMDIISSYDNNGVNKNKGITINFGIGNYYLEEALGPITDVKGKGIDKTTVEGYYTFTGALGNYLKFEDLTYIQEYDNNNYWLVLFDVIDGQEIFSEEYLTYRNIKFISKNNDVTPTFDLNEYGINLLMDNVIFENINNMQLRVAKNTTIKNCDFSKTNILLGGNYEDNVVANISNTKIKTLATDYNVKAYIDENSTFSKEPNKKYINLPFDDYNQYETNGNILYIVKSEDKPNGEIFLTRKTEKVIQVDETVLLNEVLNIDFDNEWSMSKDDIIKIEDGKIIPLQAGEVLLTNSIGVDNYKILLRVVKPKQNNEENQLVNPETLNYINLISTLMLGIMASAVAIIILKKIKTKEA